MEEQFEKVIIDESVVQKVLDYLFYCVRYRPFRLGYSQSNESRKKETNKRFRHKKLFWKKDSFGMCNLPWS